MSTDELDPRYKIRDLETRLLQATRDKDDHEARLTKALKEAEDRHAAEKESMEEDLHNTIGRMEKLQGDLNEALKPHPGGVAGFEDMVRQRDMFKAESASRLVSLTEKAAEAKKEWTRAERAEADLSAQSEELKKWKTWDEDDKPDKFSPIIEQYNPARGGPDARHDLMNLAMELIAPRKSKFSIVFLLVALLADSEAILKKGGIKK